MTPLLVALDSERPRRRCGWRERWHRMSVASRSASSSLWDRADGVSRSVSWRSRSSPTPSSPTSPTRSRPPPASWGLGRSLGLGACHRRARDDQGGGRGLDRGGRGHQSGVLAVTVSDQSRSERAWLGAGSRAPLASKRPAWPGWRPRPGPREWFRRSGTGRCRPGRPRPLAGHARHPPDRKATPDDQARVATPAEAVTRGGSARDRRPITRAGSGAAARSRATAIRRRS